MVRAKGRDVQGLRSNGFGGLGDGKAKVAIGERPKGQVALSTRGVLDQEGARPDVAGTIEGNAAVELLGLRRDVELLGVAEQPDATRGCGDDLQGSKAEQLFCSQVGLEHDRPREAQLLTTFFPQVERHGIVEALDELHTALVPLVGAVLGKAVHQEEATRTLEAIHVRALLLRLHLDEG